MKCDQSHTACAAPSSFASSTLAIAEVELDGGTTDDGPGSRRAPGHSPAQASRAAGLTPANGGPAPGVRSAVADDPMVASLEARRRAAQVLRTLLEESALLESRLADSGRLDPIRAVSGRSAMDRAIDSTRSMIGSVERLLRRQMLADSGR